MRCFRVVPSRDSITMNDCSFVLSNLVGCTGIRMVQSGSGTSFPTETFQGLRVQRQFIWQEFQGDKAPKLGVFSLIDHAHAPAAQLLDNAVVRDGLADEFRGRYR
jgi:hypothetical protein